MLDGGSISMGVPYLRGRKDGFDGISKGWNVIQGN